MKDNKTVKDEILEILNDSKRDTKDIDVILNPRGINELIDYVKKTYRIGFEDGLRRHAWMKDGYNCRECGSEGYDSALSSLQSEIKKLIEL